MNSTIVNLKKCVFPFIMMFTLLIFSVQGLMNAANAASNRVISISKDTDVSTISLKNKSILKLGKDIDSSFDLSKLPAVTEKTSFAIEIENESAEINFTGKLPDNYELPLIIADGYSYATFSEKSYNPSFYYPNKGTEKNPDILALNASKFDLSLLPDKENATYLCIMDTCQTKGIDFEDSVLPKNYVVSKIFILHEEDKQTFKDAFPKAEISVMSVSDMNKKLQELFTVENTTTPNSTTNSNNSENQSSSSKSSSAPSSSSSSDTAKTNSNKTTGDDMMSVYLLGGSFTLFGAMSLLFRKNKSC